MKYRPLTKKEVEILINNGCTASEWNSIEAKEGFNPSRCRNVQFSGKVKMGLFEKNYLDDSGVTIISGISNAVIHNCTIGDNASIYNIHDYIANYNIADNVVIRNCGRIHLEGISTFGNGTEVAVMNETGGRSVKIWDRLSSHLAYIYTLYRHRKTVIDKINDLVEEYSSSIKSDTGYIGEGTKIFNCGHIRNVKIGPFAHLEGALSLNEGSVNSNSSAPVFLGPGIIMDHFIVCSNSVISESAMVERCFIGQGCILAKHFSAHDSLFFANCQGYHGEVFSVFAGPYTVTHHKSTLLIAGIFSFMNAGSGSNQSNHMYKLGPVHQGIIERGTKTASDSYLLWPSHIGPFSLVAGHHMKNINTSMFPFSYVVEKKGESIIYPAINLRNVGIARDSLKWPQRDRRKNGKNIDSLNFHPFTPFTVNRMIKGKSILEEIKNNGCPDEEYCIENAKISRSSVENGITLYNSGIYSYIGGKILKRLAGKLIESNEDLIRLLTPVGSTGQEEWIDLSGLIVPRSKVEELLNNIESDRFESLQDISDYISTFAEGYDEWEWSWLAWQLEKLIQKNISSFNVTDIIKFIEKWQESATDIYEKKLDDARKEFSHCSMTGFGADFGEEEKMADYEHVRGNFDSNSFVRLINEEFQNDISLAREIKQVLKNIQC
ncbi:MAG TPA: DUF4954 family protein [Bacteroidales bacterium]|nr:DUF4954 family protein [Bacteroidales bacterium]HCI54459.1 DUF4954 domain-containing protein [Bacteroidales bacterium]HOU95225.1 DUF4954 family protein [Bacteroidales bacterium]HQG35993.1 DUF4954 family protein [Bacteroidales bacterium]HQJ21557.1 DUF4954 family protein [Bacteroidales bacterium]